MKKIAITLLTAFVGGALALGTYKLIENKYADSRSLEDKQKLYFTNNPLNVNSSTGDLDFTQAAAAVSPAVVHIKTTYKGQTRGGGGADPFDDMFNDFFGGRQRQSAPVMASGSGVIISDDGYIVTNNHVVENATDISVILTDKRSLKAKVIGRDPNTDLALIKVSATKLPLVKMGNSDNVRVGEWVLAVGYPFTLNTTVTAGIVSAKGRSIGILSQGDDDNPYQRRNAAPAASSAIESFIQTDAAINRGNSGGALVNTNGELIGINAAIASQSGNYEGYGFAIPINLAKKVLDDFMKYGTVKRGYIGVNFLDLDADKAKEVGTTQINGLYVSAVVPNSGAEAVGLKKGDVITKVEGNTINSSADLQERVGRLRPGDKINISYIRDSKERQATITLKGDDEVKLAGNSGRSNEEIYNKLGASFAPLSSTVKQRYHINSGLVVSEVRSGGIFDQQEVPKGTVITSVNGKAVNSVDDIDAALSAGKGDMLQLSGITPDGAQFRYSFPIGG
ncbi:Do family serine endopeptidase [Pedobacter sp. HMF7647]|uniref:Do family serine endopeptidase n=1 Tax=Hufsiella arboris TaxID=2695275 RepID=A0A7K1YAK5_9SPHI|nr:Do family serine endopeptidase [Hufsiella arboris]MXV51604.1 Do family serine endopeptidase [Hufsiella arboris]